MFDGQRTSAAAAAADSSADMDMEVRYTLLNTLIADLDCTFRCRGTQIDFCTTSHTHHFAAFTTHKYMKPKPLSKVSKPWANNVSNCIVFTTC